MKAQKSITIDENVSKEMEKEAVKQNRSFSNLVEKVLRDYLKTKN